MLYACTTYTLFGWHLCDIMVYAVHAYNINKINICFINIWINSHITFIKCFIFYLNLLKGCLCTNKQERVYHRNHSTSKFEYEISLVHALEFTSFVPLYTHKWGNNFSVLPTRIKYQINDTNLDRENIRYECVNQVKS